MDDKHYRNETENSTSVTVEENLKYLGLCIAHDIEEKNKKASQISGQNKEN